MCPRGIFSTDQGQSAWLLFNDINFFDNNVFSLPMPLNTLFFCPNHMLFKCFCSAFCFGVSLLTLPKTSKTFLKFPPPDQLIHPYYPQSQDIDRMQTDYLHNVTCVASSPTLSGSICSYLKFTGWVFTCPHFREQPYLLSSHHNYLLSSVYRIP